MSYDEVVNDNINYDGAVRVVYHTKENFKRTAKLLGLMDDFKASI